jgi:hypothetical protein
MSKTDEASFSPTTTLRGTVADATYREQDVPSYRNNPLIEALPPIWSPQEVIKLLYNAPDFSPRLRNLSAHSRIHCVHDIEQLFQPLSVHFDFESRFSCMLRQGYISRNPMKPGFHRNIREAVDAFTPGSRSRTSTRTTPKAHGFNMIGPSGIGKTDTTTTVLLLYDQVNIHREYKGQPFPYRQLVWLKLNCPYNGSPKALCKAFFMAVDDILGTNYSKYHYGSGRTNTDELIKAMQNVAAQHLLGVLIIDEIQVLQGMKWEKAEVVLNFLVYLVDEIGVPVILIGTNRALKLFEQDARHARRGTGQGDMTWDFLKGKDWSMFFQSLLKYQYVQNPIPLPLKGDDKLSPILADLSRVLYDETQGITDIVIKLWVQTQIRAITTGLETITKELVISVAADSFQTLRPALQALRSSSKEAMIRFEDVYPLWRKEYREQQQQQPAELQSSVSTAPPTEEQPEPSPTDDQMSQSAQTDHQQSPTETAPPAPDTGTGAKGKDAPGKNQSNSNGYDALKQSGLIGSLDEHLDEIK